MKPVNTNKFFMLMAASALTGAIVAATALASPNQPEAAYQKLSAVEMSEGQAPQLNGGISGLSGEEGRFHERLPVQLQGPMKKTKHAKYVRVKKSPSKKSHHQKMVKKAKSKNLS